MKKTRYKEEQIIRILREAGWSRCSSRWPRHGVCRRA